MPEELDDVRVWRDLCQLLEIGIRDYVVVGVNTGHLPSLRFNCANDSWTAHCKNRAMWENLPGEINLMFC